MIKEENVNCTVEALVLASPEPVSIKKLCEVIGELSPARIRQAVGDLNNIYMGCGNAFRIREVAGGYQVHILPDFEQPIKKLLVKQRTVRLTRAALETLAIIAYKQPVTKIEIEHIRGVATDGVIHNLLQRQLIVIAGRSESAGRPLLYKTSSEFLKFFGLNRLSDLPRLDEIEEMIRMAEAPKEQTVLPLNGDRETSIDDDGTEYELEIEGEEPVMENLVASADFSDFIGEIEDAGDNGDEPFDPSSEDDGSDAMEDIEELEDEADFDFEEPIAEPEDEPTDENREVEMLSEALLSEPDEAEATERTLPVVAYYEPIPDEPPAIFVDEQITSVGSGGGNGSSPEEHATVAGGASVALDEADEAGDKPSED